MSNNYKELYQKSYKMRKRFLEVFTKLGFGHVTTAFSMTEISIALYYEILKYKKEDPDWIDRDRLVISKGHGAGMLFPIFEDIGLIDDKELENNLRIGGNYTNLKKLFLPGFDFYGGSLGQGLGLAVGLAIGAKLNKQTYNTFCILGDAECCEGSIWEAIMYASSYNLNNLIVIVDRNRLGCADFTENMVLLEPFKAKWEAFNWNVKEIEGHSYEQLIPALKEAIYKQNRKPTCIIANTIKGKGLEYLYNKPLMHGYMPKSSEDIEKAFKELKEY